MRKIIGMKLEISVQKSIKNIYLKKAVAPCKNIETVYLKQFLFAEGSRKSEDSFELTAGQIELIVVNSINTYLQTD